MIEQLKEEINKLLKVKYPNCTINVQEPKDLEMGDIAIPLFEIAKNHNLSFGECQEEIEALLNKTYNHLIKKHVLVKGFLNITLDKKQIASNVLEEILIKKHHYGTSNIGNNQTIVIDFSSPNIAKPFSIGHLRSTIIGNALSNIYEKNGYKVVRINHLGDWGTQFGKLIVAYFKWGSKKLIENDKELLNEGREAFNKLENGDTDYLEIWKWFKEESIKEFKKMYELLDVSFDSSIGESFYSEKMKDVIDELENKNLLIEDDGASVVLLEDMIPALIKKSDGSTLYITRDLAALFYRKTKYNFNKMLYIIGNEQTFHLNQLKAVVKRMGYDYYNQIEHISFGLVLQNGKKMSTRKGRIVKLEDVLHEAIDLASSYIEKKNPNLVNKEEVSKAIGVSAIIFNDLKNHRIHDVEFNLLNMLQFEGQTGPNLQYTSVRINSILKHVDLNTNINIDLDLFNKSHYYEIVRALDKFQVVINKSLNEHAPSHLAKYVLNLCAIFNSFYGIERILADDMTKRNTNVALAICVKTVLDESMRLLGMKVIDEM